MGFKAEKIKYVSLKQLTRQSICLFALDWSY